MNSRMQAPNLQSSEKSLRSFHSKRSKRLLGPVVVLQGQWLPPHEQTSWYTEQAPAIRSSLSSSAVKDTISGLMYNIHFTSFFIYLPCRIRHDVHGMFSFLYYNERGNQTGACPLRFHVRRKVSQPFFYYSAWFQQVGLYCNARITKQKIKM